jgi:hypothetical protein
MSGGGEVSAESERPDHRRKDAESERPAGGGRRPRGSHPRGVEQGVKRPLTIFYLFEITQFIQVVSDHIRDPLAQGLRARRRA